MARAWDFALLLKSDPHCLLLRGSLKRFGASRIASPSSRAKAEGDLRKTLDSQSLHGHTISPHRISSNYRRRLRVVGRDSLQGACDSRLGLGQKGEPHSLLQLQRKIHRLRHGSVVTALLASEYESKQSSYDSDRALVAVLRRKCVRCT